jgi:hypothetical protein
MKYFVRADANAPVKGPFDRDAIKKSLERELMKPDAEARAEDAEEWVTLKSLFKEEDDAKDRRKEEAEFQRAVAVRNMERQAERSGGGANVAVGIVMVVAGLGLTAASLSAGRGGGVIFGGLIVFGIVRVIRGLAAS